jgi:hypothetical protein
MGEKLMYLLHSICSSLVTQEFAPFPSSSLSFKKIKDKKTNILKWILTLNAWLTKETQIELKTSKRCLLYIDLLQAMLHVPHFFSFLPIFHFTLSTIVSLELHNQILILLTLLPKNQRKASLTTSDNLTLILRITLVELWWALADARCERGAHGGGALGTRTPGMSMSRWLLLLPNGCILATCVASKGHNPF